MRNPYRIIAAFQNFAGKPMKVLDAVAALPDGQIDMMESNLRQIADNLREEDAQEWPVCHKLADQITAALGL